jgi:alpha-glucosidase (family GH31 glycosyl hydrolase)
VDLTNPAARDWLLDYQLAAARELGIDGWMADFAEWLPVDAQLASGQTGWEFHNRYPLAWQKANRRALREAHANETSENEPANNWTFFARSGWASTDAGSAGIAPLMWGGDQNTDWGYDDGFPTIVPIGAHLGMSGVAIFGSDIAGYNSLMTGHTGKELFFRWSATGAFHPLMRTHHGGDECENWHFDRDAETLAHFGRYASIHSLLFPVFQRLLDDAMERGWPMVRHPFLVEPDSPALWTGDHYSFFLGDDILVAPVLHQDALSWTITLLGQGWWPLFGDGPIHTPIDMSETSGTVAIAEIDAPITEVPVFVRPGTILPLLAEPVDSFYGSDEPGVTDLDDVANKLRLALYPGTTGDLRLPAHAGVQADGSGWLDTEALDWSTATLNDAPLPDCATAAPAESCVDAAAETARLVDVSNATFRIGDAELTITAHTPSEFTIGVAAAAWGALAESTGFTPYNENAPPSWCEGAPE